MKNIAIALALSLLVDLEATLPAVSALSATNSPVAAQTAQQSSSPNGTASNSSNSLKASATESENGVVVSPAPTKTISLSACFNEAERSNKEIKSALWNLPIAKAGIRAAGA